MRRELDPRSISMQCFESGNCRGWPATKLATDSAARRSESRRRSCPARWVPSSCTATASFSHRVRSALVEKASSKNPLRCKTGRTECGLASAIVFFSDEVARMA